MLEDELGMSEGDAEQLAKFVNGDDVDDVEALMG